MPYGYVRVITGPDRWMLQTEDDVFWIDIWAVEAIARIIRHVEELGQGYDIVSEASLRVKKKDEKKGTGQSS